MQKQEPAYEGVSRKVYTTAKDGVYIQEFSDAAAGPDGLKERDIPGKGACNSRICAAAFKLLEKNGLATHFIQPLNDNSMLIRRTKLMPLDVTCRNVVSDSFAKRISLPEGETLPLCVVEFRLNSGIVKSPLINQSLIKVSTSITEGEATVVRAMASEANHILNKWFDDMELVLVDFNLEFGIDDTGKIRLGGEISLDTCRLWDRTSHEKLDKDRFRRDLGAFEEEYADILRRVTGKTA